MPTQTQTWRDKDPKLDGYEHEEKSGNIWLTVKPWDCAQMFPSCPQMTACLTILVEINWSSTYDCHDMLRLVSYLRGRWGGSRCRPGAGGRRWWRRRRKRRRRWRKRRRRRLSHTLLDFVLAVDSPVVRSTISISPGEFAGLPAVRGHTRDEDCLECGQ